MKFVPFISAVLGMLALYFFTSVFPAAPIWGKALWVTFYVANLVSCVVAYNAANQGKTFFSPALSLVIQVGLSFLVLAIVN